VPELPEVEVVRRGLADHVVGHRLGRPEVLHPRPVRRHLAGADDFADRLVGRRVVAARRRGKYLWLSLDDDTTGDALLAHLGMSGQMLVGPTGAPDERHLRVRLPLLDTGRELRFVDQRMFGGLLVSSGGAALPCEIRHIAPDPLESDFDEAVVVGRIRHRTSGVKRILLDQSVVSGIGNIYADEGLWRARVHGDRSGDRLTSSQVRRVLTGVREVMAAALDQGGTSFDALYVNVNGQSGYFDRSLEVYGREGRPCSRCGALVIRRPFMNRSSYFCPRCQRVPARRTGPGRD
jgi:formamidopyrimidine-DNA glycosylase